nr:uncharacterized protein LOC105869161 isoform X3 [Microcebus murinus]
MTSQAVSEQVTEQRSQRGGGRCRGRSQTGLAVLSPACGARLAEGLPDFTRRAGAGIPETWRESCGTAVCLLVWMAMDCHGLPRTAMDCHGLPLTAILPWPRSSRASLVSSRPPVVAKPHQPFIWSCRTLPVLPRKMSGTWYFHNSQPIY